jgi:hypothetical protein
VAALGVQQPVADREIACEFGGEADEGGPGNDLGAQEAS